MIHILIVDDHKVLADGIRALLSQTEGIEILDHCLNGRETLNYIKKDESVELVLLDINLPDINGVNLCQKIKQSHPNIKILALTMHQEPGFIMKMVKAGADGYLLKNTGKEELETAIRQIYSGEKYFNKWVTDRLLEGMNNASSQRSHIQKITRREKEVLKLIIGEMTTEEIAEKLFISTTTVISHRKSLLRKLNAKNTAGLVRTAFELNLLEK